MTTTPAAGAGAAVASTALAAVLALAACAAAPATDEALIFARPVVLLGEVHDNAAQHALRLRAFRGWLESGARPVLAMEQFDREQQPALDAALARPGVSADMVVDAAAGDGAMSGWNWAYYKPYIALAIEYRLPIVAANVSRGDARTVMQSGLAANGFDAAVPDAVLQPLSRGIEASHCGMLDAPTARRMALAQVARDQYMARVIERNADRGVLLLAGNGHVRTDIGVPRWLTPATRSRSEAIGVVEAGGDGGAYDRRVVTAAQPRTDPCAGMRPPAQPASAAPAM